MAMLSNDWAVALNPEFHKEYYRQLYDFVREEYGRRVVYPPSERYSARFILLHCTR